MSGLVGCWRITDVDDAWDIQGELDIDEPAHLELDEAGGGHLVFFFLFSASVDARDQGDRIDFSWDGRWELDDMCGRGTAQLTSNGLDIHVWIHSGEEIGLRATRA